MENEGLPPTLGMKKRVPLIIGGYSIPTFLITLQYTDRFPKISYWTPSNPFDLIQPAEESNNSQRQGWYFVPGKGETNPFQYAELNRVREFCRELLAFLQRDYPIMYKGSKMRWNIGELNVFLLQHYGAVEVDVIEASSNPDLFHQGLTAFLGYDVYSKYENADIRSKQRQQFRGRKIQQEFNKAKEALVFDPDRVERGVKQLMKEEGLSSYNAFKKVMATTNLYNENAMGVGQAYGPWLNGYKEPEEEVEEANNTVYNGGTRYRRKNRKTRRRRTQKKN